MQFLCVRLQNLPRINIKIGDFVHYCRLYAEKQKKRYKLTNMSNYNRIAL